jgi:polyhydroxyalkanoate synthesis regulator phasin
MVYEPYTTEVREPIAGMKRVSWGAIFAGTITAIVLQIVLAVLGISFAAALGTWNLDGTTFGIAMGIWWALSALLALFAGGWVAGRLAGFTSGTVGGIHGFVTWGVVTLAGLLMLTTTLGGALGGGLGMLNRTLATTGQQVAAAAADPNIGMTEALGTGVAFGTIHAEAMVHMASPGEQQLPAQFEQQLQAAFGNNQPAQPQQLNALVAGLVNQGNLNQTQAQQTVQRWDETHRQAITTAQQGQTAPIVHDALQSMAAAAAWTFVALVLGALAATWGGIVGAPENAHVDREEHVEYREKHVVTETEPVTMRTTTTKTTDAPPAPNVETPRSDRGGGASLH